MSSSVTLLGTNLLYPLLLLPLLFLIVRHFKSSKKAASLPPGPNPWPIVGNIFHMGNKPHISLAHFAESYGPLISLRLGTQILVVGSSPQIALEILKTNDRVCSARSVPQIFFAVKNPELLNNHSLAWTIECGNRWKYLRAICHTELFSGKAMDLQTCLREQKVMDVLVYIRKMENKVVKLGEVVYAIVYNTLSNVLMSTDFMSMEDDQQDVGMKRIVREFMELGATPNLADFYPVLGVLDIQGLNRKFKKLSERMCLMWYDVIRERRGRKRESSKGDFLDALIENGFTNDQIDQLFQELFTAGTDTSSSVIEWSMAELIRYPESMRKLQEELAENMKIFNADNAIIRESDLPNLPYLQACVKETLRLHPPAPLLLPRHALDTYQVMNYTIPKSSQVLVNVWAIGRDSKIWENPLEFRPERFLGHSTIDFKGTNFEFLPFGAGRRICPGISMATKQVPLILANLIHSFNWSLPHGVQLDMSEKFGVTLQKEQPLLLIPKLGR